MDIRVRFAPSPTGPFSLGNARTALFNWLFARHENGKFLLRIEDTDKERSKKKYEKEIISALKWLGLDWDERPVRQSERSEIYKKYLLKLLSDGNAYWCFCREEDLELERQAKLSQGLPPKYGGKCRALSSEEVKSRLKTKSAVIRFKVAEKNVEFHDLIRGKVEFNSAHIGDIIIAKGLDKPLYNFAAVVDDFEMKISHVIRGEDHLSNTPKQLLLQEALGLPHPTYAHLPLILGPDRKKLSKRYLDKSLLDYRNAGFLPEAILNFLALLGWHPERDREILRREELIAEFSLKRVQKSGAIFNPEKLDWLNAIYLRELGAEDFLKGVEEFLSPSWSRDKEFLKKVIAIEKERMKKLSDFPALAHFFFELPDYPKELLLWKNVSAETIKNNLEGALEILSQLSPKKFTRKNVETAIMTFAEKRGRGEVLWPLRVALSGKDASPGPFELLDIFGKKESLKRIGVAIKKLSKQNLES
jgi:glutamyl-tRNA synthetase